MIMTFPLLVPSLTPFRVINMSRALGTLVRLTVTVFPLTVVLDTIPKFDVTDPTVTGFAKVTTTW